MAMAKLFIIARKAAPSLCMSMKISPSVPSGVLAGAEVDLVAADDRLLGVALAPLGQALAVGALDLPVDDLLDDLLGEHRHPLGRRRLGQHLLEVLVVLDQRRRRAAATELGAVAVERVRLDAERPGELVGRLAVADRRVVRHVDRLGDRARDEALRRRHHADVALDREVARAGLAAGVGAVEDRVVLGPQVRRALERHRAADVVVRRLDLRPAEAEVAQQVEGRVAQLLGRDAEHAGAELLAERPLVEDEADVEGRRQRRLDLLDLRPAEAVADQRGRVDLRRVARACRGRRRRRRSPRPPPAL